jgi:hypothetical protein
MSPEDMYTTWGPSQTPTAVQNAYTCDSTRLPSSGRKIYAVHPIPEIYLIRLNRGERLDLRNYLNEILREALNEFFIEAANTTLDTLSEVEKPRWPEIHDPDSPLGPFKVEAVAEVILLGDRQDIMEGIDACFRDSEGESKTATLNFDNDERYRDAVVEIVTKGYVAQCKAVFDRKNMDALFAVLPASVQHRRAIWDRD